jgi:hypothetical protein
MSDCRFSFVDGRLKKLAAFSHQLSAKAFADR